MERNSAAEEPRQVRALILAALACLALPCGAGLDRGRTDRLASPHPTSPSAFSPLLFGAGLEPACATVEAWQAVPGIGPKRADAIVAEQARRPFVKPSDLERVHGLGPKSVSRITPWLVAPPWRGECESTLD